MESQKFEEKNSPMREKELKTDPVEVKTAKEVIKRLGNAFSSMKIYPAENPAVKKSIETFTEKIKEFLDEYEHLDITIGEFNLSYKGENVFQDEEKMKSLPFLLFKDGMRELSFHKGLGERELQDFLETVKADSDLPPEDCDVVNSLWMKNFAYIRFFALDEFLDTRIGKESEEVDFKYNKETFSDGEVNLTTEDKIDLYKRSVALGLRFNNHKEKKEGKEEISEDMALPWQSMAVSESEIPEIESMLSESRVKSRLTELINLLFEILFLEERHDHFSATLNVLNQCYREVVHKSNFSDAFLLLNHIQELKQMLSSQFKEKEKLLDKFIKKEKEEYSLAHLRKLFFEGKIEDFDSFFQYLRLLGPETLSLVGDIWDNSKDPFIRLKASDFLQEIGQDNIPTLAYLARDSRFSLSKEIIAILGKIGSKEVIPHLENFVDHTHKTIKLETIQSLKKIADAASNKILIKFLDDEEEEVRATAALSLKYFGDNTISDSLMQLAKNKGFKKRSRVEKKALLNFLAKTKSLETCFFLQSLLKKWSIFTRAKQNETRLCAVSALQTMATPEAVNVLKEGSKLRNKKIRRACNLSLRKIAQ
ncbi:MAG: HEAT repeat domain-containing protein [Candidatus Aminicenantes bacterium]|nr:MAG: HEAT repeat domain-containing protein [Candidatus Aminicenantes bacterium]